MCPWKTEPGDTAHVVKRLRGILLRLRSYAHALSEAPRCVTKTPPPISTSRFCLPKAICIETYDEARLVKVDDGVEEYLKSFSTCVDATSSTWEGFGVQFMQAVPGQLLVKVSDNATRPTKLLLCRCSAQNGLSSGSVDAIGLHDETFDNQMSTCFPFPPSSSLDTLRFHLLLDPSPAIAHLLFSSLSHRPGVGPILYE